VFVSTRKARRLEWQDVAPRNEEQADAWEIANRNQARFSAAFSRTIRSVIDESSRQRLFNALVAGDLNGAINAFPWLNEGDEASVAIWSAYTEGLRRAYSDVLAQGATAALEEIPAPFEFISKVIGVTPTGGGTRGLIGLEVPFSQVPFSERWIEAQAARLVVSVSDTQRTMLRDLILRMFSEGRPPREMLEQIERVVGLTPRDAQAVANREALLIGQGVTVSKRTTALDRYSKQLLRRRGQNIARTELISAQSQGITDAWRIAKQEGFIASSALEEWIASRGPRTCKICIGLDGQQVPVGEPFTSELIGLIERPPAHPSCRCTRILVQ